MLYFKNCPYVPDKHESNINYAFETIINLTIKKNLIKKVNRNRKLRTIVGN